jgi:hypothetical protein
MTTVNIQKEENLGWALIFNFKTIAMKRILSYVILLTLVGVTSCKKLVEETPLSDGTLDQFFRTSFDAEAAMAGMYGQFQQTMIGESQFNNRITFLGRREV